MYINGQIIAFRNAANKNIIFNYGRWQRARRETNSHSTHIFSLIKNILLRRKNIFHICLISLQYGDILCWPQICHRTYNAYCVLITLNMMATVHTHTHMMKM